MIRQYGAMDIRKQLGERVKIQRMAQGLTQEELADKSGLSQQYISELERGLRNPTALTLLELANALEIHIASLFIE